MKCLHCKKNFSVTDSKYLPFCSSRCKSLDLSDWLTEANKISDPLTPEQEKF